MGTRPLLLLLGVPPLLLLGLRAAVGPEIAGYHVDTESCSGLVHDNVTAQRISCAAFLDMLNNLTETAKAESAGLARRLRLAVDAGTGWVCPQPQPCTPPYCGCINITWRGATRSVADHVVHFADEAVLMDYDRSAEGVYARALPYLTTADRSHGAKQVRVGVAISACFGAATKASPPCQPEGWATRNETELATLMAAAEPLLKRHPSFVGFSVFGPWMGQALDNPAPPATPWPKSSGTWYINHSMILDPDPTTKQAYLNWAATRRVAEVYIAPHAGQFALVAIPGIEGGPAGEAAFCRFITEGAKQGLDVQLFADPSNDFRFVKNCSATKDT